MRTAAKFLSLALAAALAACGGGERNASDGRPSASGGTTGCTQPPGDSAYFVATQEYLKGLTPKPRRFLSPVGTDSALPEAAFKALQDNGPSYLYPSDAAGQKKVLERLEEVGPWTALLVSWRGVERLGDSAAVIRLRGHYLLGADPNAPVTPARVLRFQCEGGRWRFARTEEERVS